VELAEELVALLRRTERGAHSDTNHAR
jgi:hypothetical protein